MPDEFSSEDSKYVNKYKLKLIEHLNGKEQKNKLAALLADKETDTLDKLFSYLQREYVRQPWYKRAWLSITSSLPTTYSLVLCARLKETLEQWEKDRYPISRLSTITQAMKQTENQLGIFSLLRFRLSRIRTIFINQLYKKGILKMFTTTDHTDKLKHIIFNTIESLNKLGRERVDSKITKRFTSHTYSQIASDLGIKDKRSCLAAKKRIEAKLVGDGTTNKWLGRGNRLEPYYKQRKIVYAELLKMTLLEYQEYLNQPSTVSSVQLQTIKNEILDLIAEIELVGEDSHSRLQGITRNLVQSWRDFSKLEIANGEALPIAKVAKEIGLQLEKPTVVQGSIARMFSRFSKTQQPQNLQFLLTSGPEMRNAWQKVLEQKGEAMQVTLRDAINQYQQLVKIHQENSRPIPTEINTLINAIETAKEKLAAYYLSSTQDEFSDRHGAVESELKVVDSWIRVASSINEARIELHGEYLYDAWVIGLEQETVTLNEVKKAYKKAALQTHPDKNQQDVEYASRKFKNAKESYDNLINMLEKPIANVSKEEDAEWKKVIEDHEAFNKEFEQLRKQTKDLNGNINEFENQLENQLIPSPRALFAPTPGKEYPTEFALKGRKMLYYGTYPDLKLAKCLRPTRPISIILFSFYICLCIG